MRERVPRGCESPADRARTRLGWLISLLFVVLSASAAQAQPPATPADQRPSFPARIESVIVDAVVLDRSGRPVEGLRAEDFRIFEDGKPQAVTSFEAVALPESAPVERTARSRVSTNTGAPAQPERSFVIVFDDVHMARDSAAQAREAVERFVDSGLREGDNVTLVPTSGGAWWSGRIPEGRQDIVAAMRRLEGLRPRNFSSDRISDFEAMRLYLHRDKQVGAEVTRRYYEHRIILEGPGVAERAQREYQTGDEHPLVRIKSAEVYAAAKARKRATLGLLERVAESLREVKGRKSILLVSEGFIHEPTLEEFRLVKQATREANAAIYFLDARGLTGLAPSYDAEIAEGNDPRDLNSVLNESFRESEGADTVAEDSGGFSIKNRNDLAKALAQVARESRAYYLLGYEPSNPRADGRFREIAVEVARDGVTVRARRGYFAPGGKPPRREKDELDPGLRSALDSPFEGTGIPLRLTSYLLGPAADGKSRVLLAGEANPAAFGFQQRQGRFEAAVETFALIASRDTGENFHNQRLLELSLPPEVRAQLERSWLPVMREFQLAPGVYQARLLLRDRRSGEVGTVHHDFEVPEWKGLQTTTPILTDVTEPVPEGSRLPPRPLPIARRQFARGRALLYAFEVFGAAADPGSGTTRVAVGFELHSADGTVLARQDPRLVASAPGGGLGQMITLSLGAASPGEHEMVLVVQDLVAGTALELRDPFEVVP